MVTDDCKTKKCCNRPTYCNTERVAMVMEVISRIQAPSTNCLMVFTRWRPYVPLHHLILGYIDGLMRVFSPKRHLNRFNGFCRVHSCVSDQYRQTHRPRPNMCSNSQPATVLMTQATSSAVNGANLAILQYQEPRQIIAISFSSYRRHKERTHRFTLETDRICRRSSG